MLGGLLRLRLRLLLLRLSFRRLQQRRLTFAGGSGVGVRQGVRRRIRHAHDDGAVIERLAGETGHIAVEQIGDAPLGVAQRRLDAEQAGGIGRAGREAKLLLAPFEAVAGRDLVGSRQRGRARLAGDVLEREPRRALSGDLDPAAAHADRVEHDLLRREGKRDAGTPHVAPIAGAVRLHVDAEHRIDDGDPARLERPRQHRAEIEPGFERAGLEQGLVEIAVLVGDLDVVESELGRRQEQKMHLAADLHLPAEQLASLGLERRTIVVPVDEERRGKQRGQHQDQQCRQSEQERVQLLCPRPGCERAVTRQPPSAPAGPGPATLTSC